VVDGGSTDDTPDILRGYGDRIRWTSGPDAGQTDAISRGFQAATGKYIAWLNSDDVYLPGAIGAAVAEMEANPGTALVYGGAEFIDRDGAVIIPAQPVAPWSLDAMLRTTNLVVQPSAFFLREAYLAIGGLDLGLNYVMDYDLWIRLGSSYPVRSTQRVVCGVRAYGETKSATGGLKRMEELERMVRSHGGPGMPSANRREMWVALRDETASAGRERHFGRAVRLALRSVPYAARAVSWRLRQTFGRSRRQPS